VRPEELGWSAGFFDGEGTISLGERVVNGLVRYRIQVLVTNTDRPALIRFQALWGGTIYKSTQNRGPLHEARQCYHLRFSRIEATRLLTEIKNCLIVKQDQAENGLAFLELAEQALAFRRRTPDFILAQMARLVARHRELSTRFHPLEAPPELPQEADPQLDFALVPHD